MSELIDRQAAIDALKQFKPEIIPYEKARSYVEETVKTMYDRIVELPTIQPERKKGEWVQIQRYKGDTQPDLECPFCKHKIGWWDMGRYCAGCGAKLKGGAE